MIAFYNDWVVYELTNWAQTFTDEKDADGNPTSESYDIIMRLVENYKNKNCTKQDYENILFHLWQIKDVE